MYVYVCVLLSMCPLLNGICVSLCVVVDVCVMSASRQERAVESQLNTSDTESHENADMLERK